MKNFKLLIMTTMIFTLNLYSVDIPDMANKCCEQLSIFGKNLANDTTTQVTTVSAVIGTIGCYQYYHYQAALVCLDKHPNSRIMYKSNLIYMTYSDFIHTIKDIHSYGEIIEFINKYCINFNWSVSDTKINNFIALAQDLQMNNNLSNDNIEAENLILQKFKNYLVLAQENMKTELIHDAINANKNAHNMYTFKSILECVNAIFQCFQ